MTYFLPIYAKLLEKMTKKCKKCAKLTLFPSYICVFEKKWTVFGTNPFDAKLKRWKKRSLFDRFFCPFFAHFVQSCAKFGHFLCEVDDFYAFFDENL